MKLYRECPSCLHGTQRDVVTGYTIDGDEITADVECRRCNGSGFIEIDEVFKDTVYSLYEYDNLGFMDAIRNIFSRNDIFG